MPPTAKKSPPMFIAAPVSFVIAPSYHGPSVGRFNVHPLSTVTGLCMRYQFLPELIVPVPSRTTKGTVYCFVPEVM